MKFRFSFRKDCSDNLEGGSQGVRLAAGTQIRGNSDSENGMKVASVAMMARKAKEKQEASRCEILQHLLLTQCREGEGV